MQVVTGKVRAIETDANGKTDVAIMEGTEVKHFIHPDEMTDGQLAELKRAQDHDRLVAVWWDDQPKKVTKVSVYGADKAEGKQRRPTAKAA